MHHLDKEKKDSRLSRNYPSHLHIRNGFNSTIMLQNRRILKQKKSPAQEKKGK